MGKTKVSICNNFNNQLRSMQLWNFPPGPNTLQGAQLNLQNSLQRSHCITTHWSRSSTMKKKLVKWELLGNSPKPKSIFLWRIERQAGSWVLIYIHVALNICLHHGWKKSIVSLGKPEVQRDRTDIKDVWGLYLFLISTPCILGVISVIAKRPAIFEGIYLKESVLLST